MATYADFLRQSETDGFKRFYYLCGNAPVWVEEALDKLRVASPALQVDRYVYWASQTALYDIVNELNTYPLSPDGHRLIVVRDAEAITDWTDILEWLTSKAFPKTTLIAISSEPRFDTAVPFKAQTCLRGHDKKQHEAGKGKVVCTTCQGWKKKFSTSGRIYEFNQTFTEAGKRVAVDYIRRQGPISTEAAKHLLDRVGWDLAVGKAVMWKLSLFDTAITPPVIDVLTPALPSSEYVSALEGGRRGEAATLARTIGPEEHSRIIGQLEADLWHLQRLHTIAARGLGPRELASSGVPYVTIERLRPAAGHYHPAKVEECRAGLMMADNVRQTYGASTGLLEVLAAIW